MSQAVINFYPYQRAWLNDRARFKIGMFSRQTGKSFVAGGECVDDCIQAEMRAKRVRWVILSRGERQASEMMEEVIKPTVKAYYEVYNILRQSGEPEYSESVFQGMDASYKALEVKFPNGSKITALPANPDTARGFSANVILDEFAFHQNSRSIWAALFPVISKGGQKLRVISTPNGKGNKFYELMTAEDSTWSRHVIDIYKAVELGCPRDIEELRAGMADEDAWAQEYELKWLDAASSWLDYDLISSVEREDAGDPSHYQDGQCFVGVDIAARNDLFVIWVAEVVHDCLITREIIARKRIRFREQDQLLDEVFKRYDVIRCAMDQTGMGEKPVEDAKGRYGETRVEGVIFSASSKLELANELKERFQDRRMLIPSGDALLRADLHAIKSQTGPTGIRRLIADSDTDGHADRFWAAALCASAAKSEYRPYEYRPVRTENIPRGSHSRQPQITRGWKRHKGVF